ncbi:lysine 2,3-aminomutase [Carboxylicivirga caseinilyticus]|uniref:lysine 2,3-aminomutase n=1 Tax=Carboxylicivirga caseinilyticus TaxID=3417572 RepID=UPI003D34452A|nr:lysine 2,3-aminomutase [Marinilabiliaceae bacterium A049]
MIYDNAQKEIAFKIAESSKFSNWKDWKWQLKHSIRSLEKFEYLTGIKFSEKERNDLKRTFEKFPLSITPYYLSLIDKNNYKNDPVFKQSFGSVDELITLKSELNDPLSEDKDSPVRGITHRYPDRVLFHVSNICSMYCRHCTRKRKVGDVDFVPSNDELMEGIEYIKRTPQVRDVLLSGGDPFMLPDSKIDWLLAEITKIPHVEIVRIGTRMPVVLPYRITDELISILKKYQPLWINTHFNHPNEITTSSKEALAKLADAGFPLGNQSVLLADVNDCPRIMKTLLHKLVQNRVRPYYLYQCDLSEGLSHFRTPIGKGIEIMESLIGHTSGFARPTYVIDAPGGGGKIPAMPNYIISWSTNKVVLRNYEGVITTYKEPDSYEPKMCDRNCEECDLELQINENNEELEAVGIEKLLSDNDDTISLIPENNERFQRRDDNA